MKKRVISSVIILAIIAVAIASRLLTPYVFDAIFIIAGIIGTIEVSKTFSNNKKSVNDNLTCTYVLVLYIGILFAIFNKSSLWQLLIYFACIVVAYFVLSLVLSLCTKEETKTEMLRNNYMKSYTKYIFTKTFRTIGILFYPALLFACLILLNHLEEFYVVTEDTVIKSISIFIDYMIIACFICSTFTDTFAMLIGSKIGGPKLCPKISPKKTISGAIGGFLFGLIGILGLYLLYNTNLVFSELIDGFQVSWLPIIAFAVLGPVLCQIGDIVASIIKRKNNVKDYGNLIPGHGGIMDRVDGLLFVSTFALIISICVCL